MKIVLSLYFECELLLNITPYQKKKTYFFLKKNTKLSSKPP